MDCGKVGALLLRLRNEKGMTQKQVADHLNLSDKTISKWERGSGCPDVSLLKELSELFAVNIEQLLAGDMQPNERDTGNLTRIKFYVCPNCASVMQAMGNAEISCCGRKLTPLTPKPADAAHTATVQDSDGAFYITFDHEMHKQHHLTFVAYVANDRLLFIKLYPEQEAAVIVPKMAGRALLRKNSRMLYYCCSQHGLYVL